MVLSTSGLMDITSSDSIFSWRINTVVVILWSLMKDRVGDILFFLSYKKIKINSNECIGNKTYFSVCLSSIFVWKQFNIFVSQCTWWCIIHHEHIMYTLGHRKLLFWICLSVCFIQLFQVTEFCTYWKLSGFVKCYRNKCTLPIKHA